MINVDQEYSREVECNYKGERYRVRDNGAILRVPREGKPKRPKDDVWTFGDKIDRGYARFCNEGVHRIVATAFLGDPPTNQHVVDHIDTNRQNNRPENLRWLTRLENILLNPITKQKIEYWCGSIESFLADPSQLSGHENEDSNFSWMRRVSQEEARNTLASWENLLSKPRPKSQRSGDAIAEWIYEKNPASAMGADILAGFEFKEVSANELPDPKEEDEIQTANLEKTKKKIVSVPAIHKTEFMAEMQKICEDAGLKYEKYHKTEKWKADIYISVGNRNIAFSVFSSEKKASEALPLMEQDGVSAFGFILNDDPDNKDCFGVHRSETSLEVSIAGDRFKLADFVKKSLENKFEHITNAKIVAVDVLLEQIECYFCKAPHHVFYARYLIDENGGKHDCMYVNPNDMPDLQFGEDILSGVKHYIDEHPEKRIVMGAVKERFSRTMNQSYMSFGCPKCDGIVGDYYLNDYIESWMYITDEKLMNRIPLKNTFVIPVNEWIVRD